MTRQLPGAKRGWEFHYKIGYGVISDACGELLLGPQYRGAFVLAGLGCTFDNVGLHFCFANKKDQEQDHGLNFDAAFRLRAMAAVSSPRTGTGCEI
jgi:hypothetical protein